MKKKTANYVMIGAGGFLFVIGLIMAAVNPDGIAIFATIAVLGAITAIAGVFSLILTKKKMNNGRVVEATFLSIDPRSNEYASFCYFELDGKETKIVVPRDVFSEKRLAPGVKYNVTLDAKEEAKGMFTAIKVERIG